MLNTLPHLTSLDSQSQQANMAFLFSNKYNQSTMPEYTLQTNTNDKLVFDPQGARIELWLNGLLILTKITRGDGKVGSTHPCTPVFGPDRDNLYGLSQHGNMRNELVKVKNQTESGIEIAYQISEANYPQGMEVIEKINLTENKFELEMIHTNTGQEPMAINAGQHCYFHAPQSFVGTQLNNQDLTEIIQTHKDGVAVKLTDNNSLVIPGMPRLSLSQKGFNFAMIWVGSNPDLTQKDQTYICVEPVEQDPNSEYFGSVASLIQPGQSRQAKFSLTIT